MYLLSLMVSDNLVSCHFNVEKKWSELNVFFSFIAFNNSLSIVPPTVTSTNSPVSAVENVSDFTILNCGFTGQPTPSATWTLPNGGAVSDSSTLYNLNIQNDVAFLVVYKPVVSKHDGAFICTVSNFLGADNSSVVLIVEGNDICLHLHLVILFCSLLHWSIVLDEGGGGVCVCVCLCVCVWGGIKVAISHHNLMPS